MRRRIIALLFIIGIVAGIATILPLTAQAEHNIPAEECPIRDWEGQLTILEPPAGASVAAGSEFRLMWTRYPDPDNEFLFYYVEVFTSDPEAPASDDQVVSDYGVLYQDFRYVPDRDRDSLRCNPVMMANAPSGYPMTIIITPMGATDELKAQYPDEDADIPVDLSMDQYKALAESNEPHIILVE